MQFVKGKYVKRYDQVCLQKRKKVTIKHLEVNFCRKLGCLFKECRIRVETGFYLRILLSMNNGMM